MKNIIFCIIVICSFLFSACAKPPATGPENAVSPVGWWRAAAPADDLDFAGLGDAVRGSMEYYLRLGPDASITLGSMRLTAEEAVKTLAEFLAIVDDPVLTPAQKSGRIRKEFALYRAVGSDGRGTVLFTGYYEPLLSCRKAKDDRFRHPLYRKPDDMIEVDLSLFGNGWPRSRISGRLDGRRLIPYYSRQEIEQKSALADRQLEILWCDDPVDVYFLQVQGSGKADLGDGTVLSVLYDGQNGHPYRSIGKRLIDIGAVTKEDMSMQAIRRYLKDHPDQLEEVLDANPSYVFFRLDVTPSVGNIGVPLTPGRSLATDSRLFPKGALALIRTERPVISGDGGITGWVPFTRFVLNQDTGGAIRGAGRADLFWGQGRDAAISAGSMKQEGELYFLVRKK